MNHLIYRNYAFICKIKTIDLRRFVVCGRQFKSPDGIWSLCLACVCYQMFVFTFPMIPRELQEEEKMHSPELNQSSFFILCLPLYQCLEVAAACISSTLAAVWKLSAKTEKEARGCASHYLLWATSSWLWSMEANTSHTSKWLDSKMLCASR